MSLCLFYRSLLKRKEEQRKVETETTAYTKEEAELWTKDVFKDIGFCLVELHRPQDNCVSGNTLGKILYTVLLVNH